MEWDWDWDSMFETHYVSDSDFWALGLVSLDYGILYKILCLRNNMVCRNDARSPPTSSSHRASHLRITWHGGFLLCA